MSYQPAVQGGGALYPDSGPGPTRLVKGNETLGLFGVLTPDEMFYTNELIELSGSPANVFYHDRQWAKIMMDGKVLFIPGGPVSTGGNWTAFYNAGLVYGENNIGKFPIGQGVLQNKTIYKGTHRFMVRLFGKNDPDPSALPDTTNQPLQDSEIGRFTAATFKSNDPQYSNSWNLFTNFATINGRATPTIPTRASNTTLKIHRYLRTQSYWEISNLSATSSGLNHRWWPVLEHIPSNSQIKPNKNKPI